MLCLQAETHVCKFQFWLGSHHLENLVPVRSESISKGSIGYTFLRNFQRCITVSHIIIILTEIVDNSWSSRRHEQGLVFVGLTVPIKASSLCKTDL